MARKHICRECYTGSVRCHWTKYLRNRDKDDQISTYNFFRTRKLTARAVIYSELGRVLTKYKANVLVEIKHPWYTVVAVDNDKFSKYPGQPDWLTVNEAKLKIQELSLKHHLYNGKPLPDPYGCKNHLYHLGL
ncbi:uncharacterized protein LOC129000592 [Macrosteles quadrilineatus]|uniref:uncharacterized protein LOC129000592 n=1 Tax=Macrosteles quadrilineatus TaxID=74068 RepID=UPI0023E0A375|nr:uncharacterized protein LOC129000592 [Macrosteles quadrilineatus]